MEQIPFVAGGVWRQLRDDMRFFPILAAALLLLGRPSAWPAPIISEFMAVNRSTVVDDDDDRSDWIELFNPTGTSVNLKGCLLYTSDAADE